MSFKYLITVDPSLTCSGWALFNVKSKDLIAIGKIRSKSTQFSMGERLQDIQDKITSIFETLKLGEKDILVCESQTTMMDPHAAFKVEQVRGMFEVIARSRSMSVPGRINPRSVQNEVMGLKGKQAARNIVKDVAVSIVSSVYGNRLAKLGFDCAPSNLKKNQDIVDAILIGSLAITRINSAILSGASLNEFFSTSVQGRVGNKLISR